jgi:hypothetical protein
MLKSLHKHWIPVLRARSKPSMRARSRPQFFAANVLPEITATRGILARTSTVLMDIDDTAF